MTKIYQKHIDLIEQREVLNIKIAEACRLEKNNALEKIRHLMELYEIKILDIYSLLEIRAAAFDIPLFRDPVSGKTWNGYGRAPKWIKGKDKSSFQIKEN